MRRRRRAEAGAAAGAVLALVGIVFGAKPATAQVAGATYADRPADATAAIPVAERPRPGYEPIGGRLGSFFLYPTLDLTAGYTDNVFGSDAGRRGDAIVTVRAGAQLVSRWSRHRLEVDGYGLVDRYRRYAGQDGGGGGAHLGGEYDVAGGAVQADLRYDIAPEDRLDVAAASTAAAPVQVATLASSLRLDRRLGRLTLTGRAQQVASRYAAAADAAQRYRDDDRSIYTGLARYDLAGGAALIVAAAYDDLGYRAATALDRSSTGIRVEGGVGVAGSGAVSGEVRVGYLSRRTASAALRDAQGVSFHADLRWTPAARLSLRLAADRDVEDAASPVAAGNLRAEARLTLDGELRHDLIVSPTLRVARLDPIGGGDGNREVETGVRAHYLVSRRYRLTARVRHVDRSAGPYPPLRATQGFVTVGVTL